MLLLLLLLLLLLRRHRASSCGWRRSRLVQKLRMTECRVDDGAATFEVGLGLALGLAPHKVRSTLAHEHDAHDGHATGTECGSGGNADAHDG